MRRAIALMCITLLAGLAAGHAAAQTADTLKELLFYRRCPLSSSLQAVYERPAKVVGRARFLTVTVTGRPAAFVQCMFADGAVYCEASAFEGPVSRKVPLPAPSVAALQRLGFAIGVGGENLSYEHAFRGTPDFDAIATLMLTALHDAYGVREETELNTYAPFAGSIITVCRY
jgi:hypothetical protein